MDRLELQSFINAVLHSLHEGDDPLETIPPDVIDDFQQGDVTDYRGETPDTVVHSDGKRYRIIVEELP